MIGRNRMKKSMTKLRFRLVALIAAALLATPAVAHESVAASRHLAESANASARLGGHYIGEGDGSRGDHFDGRFGVTTGRYGGRDVWGHWGTYYGPMVP
jgi:hypothetical protein